MRKNIINKEHNAKNFISPRILKRTKKEVLDSEKDSKKNYINKTLIVDK